MYINSMFMGRMTFSWFFQVFTIQSVSFQFKQPNPFDYLYFFI